MTDKQLTKKAHALQESRYLCEILDALHYDTAHELAKGGRRE